MLQEGITTCDSDAFRRVFKYYKKKCQAPDLAGVINFQDESTFGQNVSASPELAGYHFKLLMCQFVFTRFLGNQSLFTLLWLWFECNRR